MSIHEPGAVSRRQALAAAGVGGAALVVGPPSAASAAAARSSPLLWSRPGASGAPDVHGLHLQYGADAAREVVVSWSTPASVANPRVVLGTLHGGYGREVGARTVTYRDGVSGTEVYIHHAHVNGLAPDTEYLYAALHDG